MGPLTGGCVGIAEGGMPDVNRRPVRGANQEQCQIEHPPNVRALDWK